MDCSSLSSSSVRDRFRAAALDRDMALTDKSSDVVAGDDAWNKRVETR